MRRRISFAFLILLSAGCGKAAITPHPAVLQRLAATTVRLAVVTTVSQQTALDVAGLRASMSSGRPAPTRAAAVVVKHDAVRLMNSATRAASAVRPLSGMIRSEAVHRYLDLIVATLNAEWLEGQRLVMLCDLAWADPLSLDARDQRRLTRLSDDARWFAWQAVLLAGSALRWKSAHVSSFRYHPVGSQSPSVKGE